MGLFDGLSRQRKAKALEGMSLALAANAQRRAESERDQLRTAYVWLVGEIERLGASSEPRGLRQQLRALATAASERWIYFVELPANVTPAEVEDFKATWQRGDDVSRTVVD